MFEESIQILKCNMKEYLFVREIVKKMDGLYRWWKKKIGWICLSLGSVIITSEAEIWVSN